MSMQCLRKDRSKKALQSAIRNKSWTQSGLSPVEAAGPLAYCTRFRVLFSFSSLAPGLLGQHMQNTNQMKDGVAVLISDKADFKGKNCQSQTGTLYNVSVQFSSVARSCPTLCDPMNHSTLGLPVHHQLQSPPKPMSIESMMPSNHLILCRPLLLLPSIFPSIRVISNDMCFGSSKQSRAFLIFYWLLLLLLCFGCHC